MSPATRRWLTLAGFAGCVGLLAWVIRSTLRGVHISKLQPSSMAWSLLWQALYFLMLGLGWADLAGTGSRAASLASWSRTQALHLLPGGILTPTTRALTVTGGAKRKTAAVATEAMLQTGTAMGVAGVAMAVGSSPYWAFLSLGLPAALFGAWLAHRHGEISLPGSIKAVGWYLGARIAFCLSAIYAQASVGPEHAPWKIAGISTIAWIAGFLVVFSPGGLGVREAVYVSMMTSSLALSSGLSSAGSIAQRLSSTIGEFAVLLCVGWSTKKTPATQAEPDPPHK